MPIISGSVATLPRTLFTKLGQYRYKVFVEHLKWELKTTDGIEHDQFDHSGTVYVVSQNKQGEINGCARLLPTNQPYLLGEVFPELLNGTQPPYSSQIWEISRFAAIDFNKKNVAAHNQATISYTVQLLQASIACAVSHGAQQIITVSPIEMERWVRRSGFSISRLGPPMIVNGRPPFHACMIEIPATLQCTTTTITMSCYA